MRAYHLQTTHDQALNSVAWWLLYLTLMLDLWVRGQLVEAEICHWYVIEKTSSS